MEQADEPIASSATTTTTAKTATAKTSNPWLSPYTNLAKYEFKKMIHMRASKTRYQLVFLFLILYILSKMMGAIIVIVKTMKNAKFLQFQ